MGSGWCLLWNLLYQNGMDCIVEGLVVMCMYVCSGYLDERY